MTDTSKDPLVIVAVDVTPKDCVISIVKYPGLPQSQPPASATKTTASCPPGASIKTKVVPRSQAEAQKEDYLVSSATEQEILQLVNSKQQKLQKMEENTSAVTEASAAACGYTINKSSRRNVNGNILDLSITYYVHTDCRNLTLDTARVKLRSDYANGLFWATVTYELRAWQVVCQTVAPKDYLYSHRINSFQINDELKYSAYKLSRSGLEESIHEAGASIIFFTTFVCKLESLRRDSS